MLDLIQDSIIDCAKLIPFLFLTYLAMEYLEHKTGEKTRRLIMQGNADEPGSPKKPAWRFLAPVFGGLLGAVPQCGFSAAASNLYAGRVITLGTLLAVYLSTSDEMLPILISQRVSPGVILGLLSAKAAIGMTAGVIIDLFLSKRRPEGQGCISHICEQEHCHCEKGIFRSAFFHTAKIAFFILIVNFGLNLVLHFAGEDILTNLLRDNLLLGPLLAGLVGLIPNCAGSVVITQLYLEGSMGLGSAMSGLLTGSGVGLLVLFRVNRNRRENLKILGLLFCIGVGLGIVISFF